MQRKDVLGLGRETSLRIGAPQSRLPGPGVATEISPEAGTADEAWPGKAMFHPTACKMHWTPMRRFALRSDGICVV